MSGSYIYIPPTRHACDLPKTEDPIGTVWRCDDCGTFWKMRVDNGCDRYYARMFWRNLFRRSSWLNHLKPI
ncbi:hypothetical protein MA3A0930S_1205 [Mycobacteroides abscessus 3A-0930-S]|nr:hypothetical protein MA3A0119R_1557 [Mycobacteroides abscessus 3A-0119-R]EIV34228.1 hypothetical protein MA3A0122R_1586 [Mycobacteroides abscessus 3A-0122-R]EIV38961.1 hypothetical protein MA3A0122S_1558 [Mycobacteroides abscessus 3A-0122-S]EIV40979.1 hypothetical protein MA3A0731_1521 [Mycobacteroides abscessus 3A-0731]EIV55636.1 hypothetical protein MA3A0930S_1205 [Mycobacteroides abscessus 3A-0930-S]EIV56517.1 hypothetical protein MA3A0930R_1645 [Mycobacteroides abscessus 3A-0930-R]EIV8